MSKKECPNGHIIGGEKHISYKQDIRVFLGKKDEEKVKDKWSNENWHNSFVHKTLEEYKTEYVDKFFEIKEKGIVKNFRYVDFISNSNIRGINIISFRILNFIFYSFLNCIIYTWLFKRRRYEKLYNREFIPFNFI